MEEPVSTPATCLRGQQPRRLQRKHILASLKRICAQIELLQYSEEDRLACREVAQMLDEILARETEA